jgi:glycosyltransferase involved in cell wall biosynthesis
MKILQTSHLPQGSGSGIYINNLTSALVECGHESYVLTVENQPTTHPDFELISILFDCGKGHESTYDAPFNFPCFDSHPSTTLTFGDFKGEKLDSYLDILKTRLERVIEEKQPDVVHCHHGWVFGYLLSEMVVPYVVSLHGTELIAFQKYPWYQEKVLQGLRGAGKLLALTTEQQAKAIEIYNLAEDKFGVLGGAVDTALFRPLPVDKAAIFSQYQIPSELRNRPVVFSAGEHTPIKGVPYLLEAAKVYERSHEAPVTVVAGSGRQFESNRALANSLGLRNTFFIGRISQQEMAHWFNIADVFVVPSTYEAFGLTAVEAFACGCPVVATDVGGLSTIVNSEVGRIVERANSEAIAQKVNEMLESKFKSRVGGRAREYALTNFSWGNIARLAESFYREALY